MNKTTRIFACVAVGGLVALAGCVGSGSSPGISDFVTSCMFEVNPPGSYVHNDSDSEVRPGGGGTAEGAAAMNACIRAKAAAAGTGGAATERSEVVRTGGTVVETYTYGQPPGGAASTRPASPGSATGGESCRRRNVLSGGSGYFGCV